jgi:nicotinamidase-related amidase
MSEPLLVVDVQVGFVNDFTRHVPPRIRQLVDSGAYGPILFTRFINAPESPYQRLLKWHAMSDAPEIDLAPELAPLGSPTTIFDKHGLTGIPEPLADYLREHRFNTCHVVGIDTDMCVLKVAMDIFDLGIEPIVLVDCCASTAGLQAHLAGLAILSRNIGPHQLRLTDLEGQYLAGPPDESPDDDPTRES